MCSIRITISISASVSVSTISIMSIIDGNDDDGNKEDRAEAAPLPVSV